MSDRGTHRADIAQIIRTLQMQFDLEDRRGILTSLHREETHMPRELKTAEAIRDEVLMARN